MPRNGSQYPHYSKTKILQYKRTVEHIATKDPWKHARWTRSHGGKHQTRRQRQWNRYYLVHSTGSRIEGCKCPLLAFIYHGKDLTNRTNHKRRFLSPFCHGIRLFELCDSLTYWFYSFLTKHEPASLYFCLVSSLESAQLCPYRNLILPSKVLSPNPSKRSFLQPRPSNYFTLAIKDFLKMRH